MVVIETTLNIKGNNMASKFFKTKLNIGQKLQSMREGESFVMELSNSASWFEGQKQMQSYATKLRIKLSTEALRAVSENENVVRILRVTHSGLK